MLGPNDLEDWLDGDEDEVLRAQIASTPAIRRLERNRALTAIPGLDHFEFSLAQRFVATHYLDTHELHLLANRLGLGIAASF